MRPNKTSVGHGRRPQMVCISSGPFCKCLSCLEKSARDGLPTPVEGSMGPALGAVLSGRTPPRSRCPPAPPIRCCISDAGHASKQPVARSACPPLNRDEPPGSSARRSDEPPAAVRRWSGRDTGPLGAPSLVRSQWQALVELRAGHLIAHTGLRGISADDARQFRTYPAPTISALLRYGFIREVDGAYDITDHGLRALEVLPRR